MTSRYLQVLLRVALLVALVASTALFLDYARGAPAFCGDGGGCAAVKASAFSRIGGVGLPTIGLAAFASMFSAALLVTRQAHARVLAAALGLGALGALALIATQLFVIKAICPWCMAVDVSTLVAAAAAFGLARRAPEVEPWPLRLGWLVAGVTAVAAPMSWGGSAVSSVALPPALAELQTDATDVLVFTDFECPYCRRLHVALHAKLDGHPKPVKLRRFMAPLPFHKAADPAARAYVCTPEGSREAMADKLYAADFGAMIGDKQPGTKERPDAVAQTIVEDGVVALAAGLGLDREAFVACMASESTRKQVADEFALYKSLNLGGLPTTYVEDKLILGANVDALEQALGGVDLRAMAALLVLVVGAASWASLRRERVEAPEAQTDAA